MSRDNRKALAEDTLKVLKQGFYVNRFGVEQSVKETLDFAKQNTRVYSPVETDILIKQSLPVNSNGTTRFKVISDTTLNVVRKMVGEGMDAVLCLNFASAKNPGGGFLGGSQAQEESIARSTGLYPCLLKSEEYYQSNRTSKSCFYTDYMIYSPKVPIIKNEEGTYLDEVPLVSIITAPAVNINLVKKRNPNKLKETANVMRRRIEKVLRISHENNHKSLVLGAWGCGVFGNSPSEISGLFKEVIESKFKNVFENIVFAIYSNNNRFIQPFLDDFGD